MKYSKPALSVEQQADQLIHRGLVGDRDELIKRLKVVSYYRLSGYLYPFREIDCHGDRLDTFVSGTKLVTIWRRYNFDRRLRILLLDAIERIEVAVRTRLVYHFVQSHGAFGHLDEKNLPGFKKRSFKKRFWRNLKSLLRLKGLNYSDYERWLSALKQEQGRSKEKFVTHFGDTYSDNHEYLPVWMACELMTCGSTHQMLNGVERAVVQQIARDFGFPDQQLLSWTKAIFSLRNNCAHHSRVWNRVFGAKPSIPGRNKNPKWHTNPGFDNQRVGFMLAICYVWLGKISSTSQWKIRLFELFDDYSEIPISEMGIPVNWRTHDLWQ
jgi:abortive infection bacteriophage resistance protein